MLSKEAENRIIANCDFSHYAEIVKQECLNVTFEMQRPFILLKPKVDKIGGTWIVSYGDIEGIGDTPDKASRAFDSAFYGTNSKGKTNDN